MPRRNRVVKKLSVWWPWMQHSHNASMNRDKNHACPNIVSKHARHARDFYDVTQTPSEIRRVFFFLIYICKSDWTMCISETIHKLKVSLSILTSPMEYDNKNKTNKNFGRKFLSGRSRNLQRGTKALYKHLQ